MLFWTFDFLHPGHEYLFSQAKKYWESVLVVLSRDFRVEKIKWRLSHHNEIIRQQNLQKLDIIDEVVLGDVDDVYAPIKKYKPDVIVLGYDQQMYVEWLEKLVFDEWMNINIVRIESYKPEIYKSSILRKELEG